MRTRSVWSLVAAAALAASALPASHAAVITLASSDTIGTSSFNTGLHWSDATAPHADADYLVGISLLRTPPDGNSYTFGGNSLTIQGPNGDFGFKGSGNTGVLTVNNLVMDGGLIRAISGVNDVFQLAGATNIKSDSRIWAKQGQINLEGVLSGSATLTNPGSDDAAGTFSRRLIISNSANTFTGNIVLNNSAGGQGGRLQLASTGNLNFIIGAAGSNNSVSGNGVSQFDGTFDLNLTNASTTLGDSWTLVNTTGGQSFSSTFNVAGFHGYANGIWFDTATNGASYAFDTSTGVLTVVPVPEPASLGLLSLAGLALASRRRRA